jgi:alpha-ketoglutarate-dependent taurine dioxygenase
MSVKPKAVDLSARGLVRAEPLREGEPLPLALLPGADDIDLGNWVAHNREYLDEKLLAHGGVLFRGFDVGTVTEFDEFVRAFTPDLMDYLDQHTPRTRLSGNIYTSTEYPADHHVPFHSENSKNHLWPMRLWFCCVQSAERGGETPIADNRKVFDAVPPAVRQRFVEKQVMYVRNFGDGLGLPWQTVFQTSDRGEVERYCREAGLDYQWKDGDRLRTRHVCQSVARHPQTGEMVWFNQAHLFHVSTLAPEARESLLSLFKEEELPSNAYYGDGSKIEDSVIAEINEAYRRASVSFPWQERDILMLDNMLVAHSRAPYTGSRRVLVAMAGPHGRQDA